MLVPFNKITSNIGGHYNTDIYTFVCPYDGIYLFSTSLNQHGSTTNPGTGIYRNSQQLLRAWAWDKHESITPVIVTECESGDSVFVNVEFSGNFDAWYSPPHFTGYLLHRY